jgi:hypothetical protein
VVDPHAASRTVRSARGASAFMSPLLPVAPRREARDAPCGRLVP